MTLELKPLGNLCNLDCDYCYQFFMREAGNVMAAHKYDLDLMMDMADRSGQTAKGYTLFGGEPLLLPFADLEKVCERSYRLYKESHIQTNGTLITPEIAAMFKKYNVYVGLSIDGPNELNSLRVPAAKRSTVEEMTASTMRGLGILTEHGLQAGLIITIHRMNGTADKLPRLMSFLRWAANLGHSSGNIHMLEVDSPDAAQYCLTPEENEYAFLELAAFFQQNPDMYYDPFQEMESMMRSSNEGANCIWKSCDPMNTGAVYGIEGNGQTSNCGMVNKEGIEWTKANDMNFVRDLILYQTEPEFGGCKGCPYFIPCNGYCPGSSINHDWRNKTTYCSSLKKMFGFYADKVEAEGIIPYPKRVDREQMEELYIHALMTNQPKPTMEELDRMLGGVR